MSDASSAAICGLEAMWGEVAAARNRFQRVLKPVDSFSLDEYAERFGCNRGTADSQLSALVSEGKMEKIRCYLIDGAGIRRPGNAYRPIPK